MHIEVQKIFPEIIQYYCLFIYSQEHFSPKKGGRNIPYKVFFLMINSHQITLVSVRNPKRSLSTKKAFHYYY